MGYYDPDDDRFDFFDEDSWEEGKAIDRAFCGCLGILIILATLFIISYL